MAPTTVIPCAGKGEVHDALNRTADHIAGAMWEAMSVLLSAPEGVATPDQIIRAAELRAEVLSLAGTLGAICAVVPASRPSIPHSRAA